MSNASFGEIVHPEHCRVSVSGDMTHLALTFQDEKRTPLTLVLPLLGAAGLQQKLAQSLHLLGVRPISEQPAPVAEPIVN